jgi:glutathione S-transferase
MYTLHGRRASGSAVVEAMLELAGADYRMETVPPGDGRQAPEAYRRLNPLGQVPTLVMPDGAVMTESAAITMHLADCFPALGLAPAAGTPARAQYMRWMLFLAASLYASNMRAYYGERYTADPAGGDMVKEEAHARVAREWDIFAAALGKGPFILGETMSAVDLYASMLAGWNLDLDAFWARHPNIKVLHDRVKAVPAIGRVWERNDL